MIQKQADETRLFEQFPEVSRTEWEAVITEDLKGADYGKKLVWRPLEGFSVQPYYRAEDLAALPNRDVVPGEYPYIRGNHAKENPWYVREDIPVETPRRGNELALHALEIGVDAIGFTLDERENFTTDFFVELLRGIDPRAAEVNFICHGGGSKLFTPLLEAFTKLGAPWTSGEVVHGAVEFAPLSASLRRGTVGDIDALCNGVKVALDFRGKFPGIRTLCADGIHLHNAGATAVQELAFVLSQAMEYLQQMQQRGVDPRITAGAMRFNFAVGTVYFMEMAKLRAARWLWARALEAFGIKSGEYTKMEAHVQTSRWNQTVYDPHVNLLRATTEGMSAVIAGVHSLTVTPFDAPFADPNEFSLHLARNAQFLLRDEAYFNRVVDPAGGSYYIETLTYQLTKSAWELFLQVEVKGGFLECLRSGFIRQEIERVGQERRRRVATRRDTLLGTNEFPNFQEHLSPEQLSSLRACQDRVPSCEKSAVCTEGTVQPLANFRGAEEFERLRMATDLLPRRPKAFMLTVGNLAMRRARAQFSCNFLASAGIEVIDNIGFNSVEEGFAAARAAGSDIVVLCSSDDEYAAFGPEAFKMVNPQKELFIVAGAPACQAELEAVGIEHFISVKSNLLETLQGFMRILAPRVGR